MDSFNRQLDRLGWMGVWRCCATRVSNRQASGLGRQRSARCRSVRTLGSHTALSSPSLCHRQSSVLALGQEEDAGHGAPLRQKELAGHVKPLGQVAEAPEDVTAAMDGDVACQESAEHGVVAMRLSEAVAVWY